MAKQSSLALVQTWPPRTADDCRTLNKQPLLHWHPMKLYQQVLVGVKGSVKLETVMERQEAVEMP